MIAVSADAEARACDFAAAMRLSFPMLRDPDQKLSRQYGVVRRLLRVNRRVTYVIDPEGVIRGVFDHELLIARHVGDVLALLRRARDPGPAV